MVRNPAPEPRAPTLSPLERFASINRERLRRIREAMTPRQQDFLEVLPLLFHTNAPGLPGFLSPGTPAGIVDFAPSTQCLTVARRVARTHNIKLRTPHRYEILGIYFMGSTGTIAHSGKSDFDVWLCHRTDLSATGLAELQRKALAVEAWATELELEVHFFVFDPASFRRGESISLSGESSGSSQHYLLLDEFYRSGLVVAGLFPVWFHVPPEAATEHDAYVAGLVDEWPRDQPYVDFGGLAHVPAEEFFGASVWQLSKGLSSPYKSVLKLLLMEVYAAEYPGIDLLSQRYKRSVHQGQTGLDELDPYVLMYRKVEEYLLGQDDHSRLDLARRCFYLKVNERLSESVTAAAVTWRRELMLRLTQEWGWDTAQLALLDTKDSWKIHAVRDESRLLVAALTRSYRQLSQFAREKAADSSITQRDLNTLGRKLYAAFERKAGKIELVNRGITDSLREERVTLHALGSPGGGAGWVLFRDRVALEDMGALTPIKRAAHPIELVAWGHFNRILDVRSQITLAAPAGHFDQRAARYMLEALEQVFPRGATQEATVEDLNRSPVVRAGTLLVNVGIDPREGRLPDGHHLTSARNNPLSYGGLRENFVQGIDLVLETSWQELFTFRYSGDDALLDCLLEYLRWSDTTRRRPPGPLHVFCNSPVYGLTIQRRIQEILDEARRVFFERPGGAAARYVVETGTGYAVLSLENGRPRGERLASFPALLRHLGKPASVFSPVVFDRASLVDSVLPLVYQANRPDTVQVFVHDHAGVTDLFVLDETGALFHQELQTDRGPAVLAHLRRFFTSILRRSQDTVIDLGNLADTPAVEYFAISPGPARERRLLRIADDTSAEAAAYLDLQVIATVDEAGSTVFTLYCNGREYSTLEHGGELFRAVAHDILTQRGSGQRYPVYITDIDLSRTLLALEAPRKLQTCSLLHYKKNIEERLSVAMRSAQ